MNMVLRLKGKRSVEEREGANIATKFTARFLDFPKIRRWLRQLRIPNANWNSWWRTAEHRAKVRRILIASSRRRRRIEHAF